MDKVTPSKFAYSTVSTRLPSMTLLDIEFLTFSSIVKQITMFIDFLVDFHTVIIGPIDSYVY